MHPWLQNNYDYQKAHICIIQRQSSNNKKCNGINNLTGTQSGRGASIAPECRQLTFESATSVHVCVVSRIPHMDQVRSRSG
jgi:hypothetical protein